MSPSRRRSRATKKKTPKRKRKKQTKRQVVVQATPPPIHRDSPDTGQDKIEFSPNTRASCRRCLQKIAKGDKRAGIAETSQRFGDFYLYYHTGCLTSTEQTRLRLGGMDPTAALNRQLQEQNVNRRTLRVRQELRVCLDRVRGEFARRLSQNAFLVLNNAVLDELTIHMPRTRQEFLNIKGLGPKKYQSFGTPILRVIAAYRARNMPTAAVARQRQVKLSAASVSRLQKTPRTSQVIAIDDSSDEEDEGGEDEVLDMTAKTIDQLVDEKFQDAQKNGYLIEL